MWGTNALPLQGLIMASYVDRVQRQGCHVCLLCAATTCEQDTLLRDSSWFTGACVQLFGSESRHVSGLPVVSCTALAECTD